MSDIKQQAIQHYKRMIKAAKDFPKLEIPTHYRMVSSIGEGWGRFDCPYCNKFWSEEWNCKCPLINEKERKKGCCDGLWSLMSHSSTWREWIMYAKRVLKYIKKHG